MSTKEILERYFKIDLLAAFLITLMMAAISWILAGAPGTNGIDDAAITRSYSQNIANGFGFVYNISGERVEGATSLLWTMILVIPYLFDSNPEFTILAITSLFTVISVFLGLRILRRALAGLGPNQAVALMLLALIGLPGFFIWSVWSMMEISLWSALCMLTLDRMSHLAEETDDVPVFDKWLMVAGLLMPLTRPEGVAIIAGLGIFLIILRPAVWRPVCLALLVTALSFVIMVMGRIAYFGFPWPNTFYAKVSTDRLQNIFDGAKYLISFVTEQPFGEVMVAGWVLLGAISCARLLSYKTAGLHTQALASAMVLGFLIVYVMLGGDHFALWRFYQPIMPIMALPLILSALWVFDLARREGGYYLNRTVIVAVLASGMWIAINNVFYYQERFDVEKEYSLSRRGEVFGEFINDIEPQPVMGIVAAGGIALTYDGELRDLLGLNWVEMAHANPLKVGFRNHASFDVDTFWKHQPDLLPQYHKIDCQRDGWAEQSGPRETGVKVLFYQRKFQEAYTPIVMEMGDGACTQGFAANTWLEQVESPKIIAKNWDDVTIVGAATTD